MLEMHTRLWPIGKKPLQGFNTPKEPRMVEHGWRLVGYSGEGKLRMVEYDGRKMVGGGGVYREGRTGEGLDYGVL